jgi:hypothetical protein
VVAADKKEFLTAAHYCAADVSRFMQEMGGLLVEHAQSDRRRYCLEAPWDRSKKWMLTLTKLNQPSDFQAVSAANRSLFEITVDMCLLHADTSGERGRACYLWAMSERMRHVEGVVSFFPTGGVELATTFAGFEEFHNDEKAAYDEVRRTLWPGKQGQPRHPSRWTGRSGIADDLAEADIAFRDTICSILGMSLQAYYKSEYRLLSWAVHSGIAATWAADWDRLAALSGRAFMKAADLALICTRILIEDVDLAKPRTALFAEWEEVREFRSTIYERVRRHLGLQR